jgi:GNAT superfamily N-acetyltransferase
MREVTKLMYQLEDLYIKEKHRGAGQGKRLFGELGSIAKERGCSRVEWRVLKVSAYVNNSREASSKKEAHTVCSGINHQSISTSNA